MKKHTSYKVILGAIAGLVIVGGALYSNSTLLSGNLTIPIGTKIITTDVCKTIKLSKPTLTSVMEFQKDNLKLGLSNVQTSCLPSISFIIKTGEGTNIFKYDANKQNYVLDNSGASGKILPDTNEFFTYSSADKNMVLNFNKPVYKNSTSSDFYLRNPYGSSWSPLKDDTLTITLYYKDSKLDEYSVPFKSLLKSFSLMVNGVEATSNTVVHPGDKVSMKLVSNSSDCFECQNYRVDFYGPKDQNATIMLNQIQNAYNTSTETTLPTWSSTSTSYNVYGVISVSLNQGMANRSWSTAKYSALKQ